VRPSVYEESITRQIININNEIKTIKNSIAENRAKSKTAKVMLEYKQSLCNKKIFNISLCV
jgi:hypothetical protein